MLSRIFGSEREAVIGVFRMLNNEELSKLQTPCLVLLDDQIMKVEIRGCM